MARGFNIGQLPAGSSVNTLDYNPTVGQTFKKGAVVVLDSNGTLVEAGATPTLVLGVAGADAFSGFGYNPANANLTTVTTGQSEKSSGVPVMLADRAQRFTGRGVNGGTDPVTPTLAMRKTKYGIAKVGNDWVINIADTTNLCVQVEDVDIDNKVFKFKFIEAAIQLA